MNYSPEKPEVYVFDRFRLDASTRRLVDISSGKSVPLPPKTFELLLLLVRNRGRLVTKEMILNYVWAERFVEENNLTVRVAELRKALGEKRGENKFIETVSGQGYRFTGSLRGEADKPARAKDPGKLFDSLAVLPFANESGDLSLEYVSDGVTESVINNLSQLPRIKVISRNTAFRLKGDDSDPRQVGERLGVQAILTGRMRKVGEHFILSAELIDCAEDSQIWGARFRYQSNDIFEMQRAVAKEVAAGLLVKLTTDEKRLLSKPYPENTEVYHLYLKGRFFWNKRSLEGIGSAIKYFERAIEKDPQYALAYSGLADCYVILFSFGFNSREEVFPKAEAAALRALEIDDSLAEAHTSLAYIRFNNQNWSEAEKEFKRSIGLNPNYPQARFWYASYLASMGRFEEAFFELDRARLIDPLSLAVNKAICKTLYLSRQYDAAIKKCREALEIDEGYDSARGILGLAYLGKQMYQESAREFEKIVGLSKGDAECLDDDGAATSEILKKIFTPGAHPESVAVLGYIYALSGKGREALELLGGLMDLSKRRYVEPFTIAFVHLGLGDKEQALEWLERAYADQSMILNFLKVYPLFDSLRSEARFQNLLRRVGFEK